VERLGCNLKPCDLALVENEMNVKTGGRIFNGFNKKLDIIVCGINLRQLKAFKLQKSYSF